MERSSLLAAVCILAVASLPSSVTAGTCKPPTGDSLLTLAADAFIAGVWVDGVQLCWPAFKNIKKEAECNVKTVNIPYEALVIGVKATNHHAFAGIVACIKGTETGVYDTWKCQKASEVTGNSWSQLGYDDSAWKKAANSQISTCKNLPSNQCGQSKKSWFWFSDRSEPDVACRLQRCMKNCRQCDKAGPGKCDGQQYCAYGYNIDPITGKYLCNSACVVDIQSYGLTQSASSDKSWARARNAAGPAFQTQFPYYFAPPASWTSAEFVLTVNMTTCSLVDEKIINTCPNQYLTTQALNTLVPNPLYKYKTALDITFNRDGTFPSCPAPYIQTWVFDPSASTGSVSAINDFNANARFTLTGITGVLPVLRPCKCQCSPDKTSCVPCSC